MKDDDRPHLGSFTSSAFDGPNDKIGMLYAPMEKMIIREGASSYFNWCQLLRKNGFTDFRVQFFEISAALISILGIYSSRSVVMTPGGGLWQKLAFPGWATGRLFFVGGCGPPRCAAPSRRESLLFGRAGVQVLATYDL